MMTHSYPTEWLFGGCVLLGLVAAQLSNPLVAAVPAVAAGVAHYVAVGRRRIRPRLMAPGAALPWLFLGAGVAIVLDQLRKPQTAGPQFIGLGLFFGFLAHITYSWATYALVQRSVLNRNGKAFDEANSPWQFRMWVGFLMLASLLFLAVAVAAAQPE